MKKTLFAIVLVAALLILLTGTVLANGGPHGGFTATSPECASCHRAHTATNVRLLLVNPATLCTSCHGAAGSGANTNVDDGRYLSTRDDPPGGNWNHGAGSTADNGNLLGGGFVNYKGAAMTSNHTLGQTNTWGQNATDRGTATALAAGATLQCVSCHDPHGSTNYRIMKTTVNGAAVAIALVDEGGAKDYDNENWGTGQSSVCAACHQAYHQTALGQGSTLSGATYTHRVDMAWNGPLPAGVTVGANNPETVGYSAAAGDEVPLAGTTVPCQTCHLPHGTSATMTVVSTNGIPTADSALLRLNDRGVCQACHQK